VWSLTPVKKRPWPASFKEFTEQELQEKISILQNNPDIACTPYLQQIAIYPHLQPSLFDLLLHPFDCSYYHRASPCSKLKDIKIPTFNGYVNNIREPNIETLIKIADFFNVTVDFLIGHNTLNDNEKIDIIPVNSRIEHLDEGLNSFVNDPDNKIFIEMAREIKHKLIIEGYGKLNT